MFAERPIIQRLTGDRLHLQHGPIDVVLRAWGERGAVALAYEAAATRFQAVLGELVGELGELRKPMAASPDISESVARRMVEACAPFTDVFITPMAAVAGAVADELLATMLKAAPLAKAFVNDGGDIAVHIAPGERLEIGIAGDFGGGDIPAMNGRLSLTAADGIGGIATSGQGGRSFSLGIADSVTVLARNAAAADAAATLIANAVNIESPAIRRRPACDLDPDSDLGERLVTVDVGPLSRTEVQTALGRGQDRAEIYCRAGLIVAAVLMLQGETLTIGESFGSRRPALEGTHP
jgi:uncharacterized protein